MSPRIPGIGGGFVDCQESSNAVQPALWLTVRRSDDSGMATVQLTLDNARELAHYLNYLTAHHYQLDGAL